MSTGKAILHAIRHELNLSEYRKKHWEGSFEEYLDIVAEHPEVTRTAYQRLYDMILSHGTEEVFENKEKIIRYKFFTDYAAKHGETALDGTGKDSPFATALARDLKEHVEVRKLFDIVRDDVWTATKHEQQPFTYGSPPGREDFYFAGK